MFRLHHFFLQNVDFEMIKQKEEIRRRPLWVETKKFVKWIPSVESACRSGKNIAKQNPRKNI